jgi:proteasome activator subunit 4
MLLKEGSKTDFDSLETEYETPGLLVSTIGAQCGFTLEDPTDPRYGRAEVHRLHFASTLKSAAVALRQLTGGEDHLDAVIEVAKSIDCYLLDYAASRDTLDSMTKAYSQALQ